MVKIRLSFSKQVDFYLEFEGLKLEVIVGTLANRPSLNGGGGPFGIERQKIPRDICH
jgi:hypothetical protein